MKFTMLKYSITSLKIRDGKASRLVAQPKALLYTITLLKIMEKLIVEIRTTEFKSEKGLVDCSITILLRSVLATVSSCLALGTTLSMTTLSSMLVQAEYSVTSAIHQAPVSSFLTTPL